MMVPFIFEIWVSQVSFILMWAPRYLTDVPGGWMVSGAPVGVQVRVLVRALPCWSFPITMVLA